MVVPDGPKVRKMRLCSLQKILNGADSEFWLADNACSVACVFSVLSVRKGRWYRGWTRKLLLVPRMVRVVI